MIVEIRNRQRRRAVDLKLLKRITLELLSDHLELTEVELGILLVSAREMARVNQQYLQHEGSTDVITFDHSLVPVVVPTLPTVIHGELYICVEDAEVQAVEFGTSWQEEMVRYVIHGILHLCGYDDLKPAPRREMKRAEARWLRTMAKAHDLSQVGGSPKRKVKVRGRNSRP